ncbi:MAG: hypothetical protein JO019_00085 [Candidatus Kaiserbacteria bacterium]|nr:hypothetical protein [Candidatus Kaiserbacteria bacterium]
MITTHRVRAFTPLSPAAIAKLETASGNGTNCRFEFSDDIANCDTAVMRTMDFNVDEFPNLKLIVRAGTEANKIVGNRVVNGEACVQMTLGANSDSVAQEVLFAVIGLSRQFHRGDAFVRTQLDYSLPKKDFETGEEGFETMKSKMVGRELSSLTVGVIGVGQIGIRVIQMLLLLGVRVIAHDTNRRSPLYRLLPPSVERANTVDQLLEKSDFVTVHTPGENNQHLISAARLAKMRKGAGLINCARGEVCDSVAILSALNEGKLGGYFTDFPDQKLPPHPLIMCQPHEGGNTKEAQARCGDLAADQIIDFYKQGNVWSPKNWPENVLEPSSAAVMRVTVPHRNQDGVLAQIEPIIAVGPRVNISNTHTSTNTQFGYYIADCDQPVSAEKIARIRAITGVIDVMTFTF